MLKGPVLCLYQLEFFHSATPDPREEKKNVAI